MPRLFSFDPIFRQNFGRETAVAAFIGPVRGTGLLLGSFASID